MRKTYFGRHHELCRKYVLAFADNFKCNNFRFVQNEMTFCVLLRPPITAAP
jgi:hypothetical protein